MTIYDDIGDESYSVLIEQLGGRPVWMNRFSDRAVHALLRAGWSENQVYSATKDELRTIENIGGRTADEILLAIGTKSYENTLNNTKVENDCLIKDGRVLISVGDEYKDKVNSFRSYRCSFIDLHFIHFEKVNVGSFEEFELGKTQEFQTVHFINNELDLVKIN